MMDAEQRKRKTSHDLCNFLDEFISDNEGSPSVDHRWLADCMKHPLALAREVRAGTKANKAAVDAFRLVEIEAEKRRRQSDIEVLDREAATIRKVEE